MNEPSIFNPHTFNNEDKTMPNNTIFYDFGLYSSHKKIHNVYGLCMAQASFEGLSKLFKKKRTFLLSRSGFSGLQRYAASWTGDNTSSFSHLALHIPMLLNMGISGTPFVGADIGGFAGSASPELLTRWYEASVFMPFMREHADQFASPQEPWAYGEPYQSIIRKYINMRYELLPYLYSCFYKAHIDGSPILRPLVYEFQNDETTYSIQDEFMVGDSILVAPVIEPEILGRNVYLPNTTWYDYKTKKAVKGGSWRYFNTPLDTIPIFIKEGSIIFKKELSQYVDEKPIDALTLEVYPLKTSRSSSSLLYLDDGKTKNSPFALYLFNMEHDNDGLKITINKTGDFSEVKKFNVITYSEIPSKIYLDEVPVDFKFHDSRVFFAITPKTKSIIIKY